ncbi:MAG: hypothetical protein IPO21_10785 [Bacteroidales bacterium]|nr:hypothetical protein [Bacteroidales bacterium]
MKQCTLENALRILFFDDDISFSAVGFQVILYRKERKPSEKPVRDTIWTKVVDTTIISIKTHVQYFDTVTIYDTVRINPNTKPKKPKEKPKLNFIAARYDYNFQSLKFTNDGQSFLNWEKGTMQSHCMQLNLGKTSKHWEISTGVGFTALKQYTPYSVNIPHQYTVFDSTAGYQVFYDSAYIAIPMVDTLWLVEQRIEIIYKKKSRKVLDSIVEHKENRNTFYYLTIPVQLSLKQQTRKKHCLLLSFEAKSHILLKNNFAAPQFANDSLLLQSNIAPTPAFFTGSIMAGADFKLSNSTFLSVLPQVSYAFTPFLYSPEYQHRNGFAFGINIGLKKYF